jgi:hypothetical protein
MDWPRWLKKLFAAPHEMRRATTTPVASDLSDEDEIDLFNPFPAPVRLEITDVFDLHTIAPRDVKRVVEEYLLEARRAKFPSVRIKGRGVQRRTVQSILARTPFVISWTNAPPHAGGWGATVAHLKVEEDERR